MDFNEKGERFYKRKPEPCLSFLKKIAGFGIMKNEVEVR